MRSGSSSGATVAGAGSGRSTVNAWSALDRRCSAAAPNGPVTCPSLISRWSCARDWSGRSSGQELIEPHAVVLGLDDEHAAPGMFGSHARRSTAAAAGRAARPAGPAAAPARAA